ncbi:MAG: helix-turn-helix domain-containing protein [Thermoguttaceae bacterium]
MAKKTRSAIDCRRLDLDGIRYVILRESAFDDLCEKAGVCPSQAPADGPPEGTLNLDQVSLAEKLVRRRQAAGLSQAELARRAAVRPETLNRIERGRTTPDFATVRKLVVAMDDAERERITGSLPSTNF